jgi:hypothetical protein
MNHKIVHKYIIVMGPEPERKMSAIIFPKCLIHRSIARVHRANDNDIKLKGAGFCSIGKAVSVWGESDSLGIKSKPEDALVIAEDFIGKTDDKLPENDG